MAEDLGRRLLMEIEEVGFNEILQTLRLQYEDLKAYFGLPQLDRLLSIADSSKLHTARAKTTQPVIELTSTAPGAGKTHLLYHLTALAVLPLHLGGKASCAVILDTDNALSVAALAQRITLLITARAPGTSAEDQGNLLLEALKHIHIFQPQTLASTIATLTSLPDYLFNKDRHYSSTRPVGFIALDSASAFHWPAKAAEETAALLSRTSTSAPGTDGRETEPEADYTHLTTTIKNAIGAFQCPAILTSRYLGPPLAPSGPHNHNHADPLSLRPSLPPPLSTLPTLRLLVGRTAVRKFPAGSSIEEALREAPDRRRAVEEGRFECVVNFWGLDGKGVMGLREAGGGLGFRIREEGLEMEERGARDEGGDEE